VLQRTVPLAGVYDRLKVSRSPVVTGFAPHEPAHPGLPDRAAGGRETIGHRTKWEGSDVARFIMVLDVDPRVDGGAGSLASKASSLLRMIAYRVQMGNAGPDYREVEREDGTKMGRFRWIADD
jgi:hypothetical protein